MRHDEAFELLAPLAIDAVEDGERGEVEAHVAGCARCQLELASMVGVAGAVGNVVDAPPERVWTAISERLYETPGAPPLAPVIAPARWWRRPGARAWLAAAAALVAVVVLSVQLAGAGRRAPGIGGAHAALSVPGHRVVSLETPAHAVAVRFVTLPGGRAYLLSSTLAALPARETYQLWDVVGGRPISLGLLGSDPRDAVAMVPVSAAPSTLAITVEPAGGSVAPTAAPVASGAA